MPCGWEPPARANENPTTNRKPAMETRTARRKRFAFKSTARRYHRPPLCIRKRLPWGGVFPRVLLVEQPHHEPADREQEDERLLAVHQDPAKVLVADRRQPPQSRRVLVERVERAARENVSEAEERRAEEGDDEIRQPRRRREAAAHDRPPEEQAGRDQDRVLDAQAPSRAQGPVVERRDVGQVPRAEPDREDPAGAERPQPSTAELRPQPRGQTQQDEERREVRDEPVLQQVDEQEVLRSDRLEWRVERGRGQEDPGGEGGDAPRRRPAGARGAPVEHGRRDGEREEERLEAEGRRAHVAAARRALRARIQRGRRSSATQMPSVRSCSTIITIPESCWSVSAETPYAPR